MVFLSRTVLWWNKELSSLTTSTRWQCNQTKRTGNWESYKTAVTCYNEQIRKATQLSWRDYCCEIKDVPERFRLMRGMASQLVNMVGSIKLQLEKETLKEIYKFNFSGSAGVVVTFETQG
jgi:hypothetical protein